MQDDSLPFSTHPSIDEITISSRDAEKLLGIYVGN